MEKGGAVGGPSAPAQRPSLREGDGLPVRMVTGRLASAFHGQAMQEGMTRRVK